MKRHPNFRTSIRPQQMNLGVETFAGITEEDRLLRTHEAAEFLAVSPHTLKLWRKRSRWRGPDFIRVEGCIRYSMQDLRRYLENRTVVPGEKNRRAR